MSDPVARLSQAEARSVAARARLSVTLGDIQARMEPKRLMRDTLREVTQSGTTAVASARGNPGPLAGIIAAAGLYLARHRIIGLFRSRPDPEPARHKRGKP